MQGRASESPPAPARAPAPLKRTLVLGLGNDIMCDDAVGLCLARELRDPLEKMGVTVVDSNESGLGLLDLIAGYDRLIVIDAIQTRDAPSGFIHELSFENLATISTTSPHFLGLGEALALGRLVSLRVPERVKIFAIEVADPFTVKTTLTPALQAAFPQTLALLRQRLEQTLYML